MDEEKIKAFKDEQKRLAEVKQQNETVSSASAKLERQVILQAEKSRRNTQKVEVTNQPEIKVEHTNDYAPLLSSLKDVQTAIANIPKVVIPESPKVDSVSVSNLNNYSDQLTSLISAVEGIEVNPQVKVDPVKIPKIDLSSMVAKLDEVVKTIKSVKPVEIPKLDLSNLESTMESVKSAIEGLVFPVANYVLPFTLGGKATQITLNSDGSLPTSGAAGKSNNAVIPGATNTGVLNGVANDALPTYIEGNQVIPALDLRGVARSVGVPMAALGYYSWQGLTGVYNGLAANTPLFSLRWGDATRLCVILKVEVAVITSTTASAAGITERQLIIARSFTVADTGGTAATLTGNNAKRRTSMGTSLISDMRIGAPITAGTRTLDAQPVSTVIGWSPLLNTGITIGGVGGVSTVAATSSAIAGGIGGVKLLDAINGQEYPIVLAQNEGIVVRIGAVQPTGAVQQTSVTVTWAEANKVY